MDPIWSPPQVHGVLSADAYRNAALAFGLQRSVFRQLRRRRERPEAFVSDGRWVIDCECGNGPSASPEWGLAICFECGSEYEPTFPREREQIETALVERPMRRTRNWRPGETAPSLVRENAEHGIPTGGRP